VASDDEPEVLDGGDELRLEETKEGVDIEREIETEREAPVDSFGVL